MSHLLSSVNPEAAIEMHEMPPIGLRVQYFARPGQGRGGKNVFPADVTFTDARKGTVTLNVYFGKEDWVEYEHVRPRDDQNPYHGWDYMPDGIDEVFAELDRLLKENDSLKEQISALDMAIFGEYNRPAKSVVELLAEFEARVFAAEGKKPKK